MNREFIASAAFIFVVILVAPGQAQSQSSSAPKQRKVWLAPPTGSHLGGGLADAGDDRPASKSPAATSAAVNDPALGKAVAQLDAQSTTAVEGWALIAAAVANQTGVPVRTLRAQHAATNLTYGELLVANSLTSGTGKSFKDVVALHAGGKTWAQLAKEFNIQISSITARAVAASNSIKLAESRRHVRREQHMKDTGFQIGGRTRDPRGSP